MQLRPYQIDMLDRARRAVAGAQKGVVLVGPTGCGKGTIVAEIVRGASAKGKRVVFYVERRLLVDDMSRRLSALGVKHGVRMAGDARFRPDLPVQVCSVQTVRSRGVLPKADLVVVDECHLAGSRTWGEILQAHRMDGAKILGMTATPCRADGVGLHHHFDRLVIGPTSAELTEQGFLCPIRVYSVDEVDTSKIGIRNGDYANDELGRISSTAKLVGNIVGTWKRRAKDLPTVVFGVNRYHAKYIYEEFERQNVAVGYMDGETRNRDKLFRNLEGGSISVLCTVDVLSYGVDLPFLRVAIMGRKTGSLAVYLQQQGRIRRPAPGKAQAILLDHAGNVRLHGMPDDDREWTLEGAKQRAAALRESTENTKVCPQCMETYSLDVGQCRCGYTFSRRVELPKVAEGELVEVKDVAIPKYYEFDDAEKRLEMIARTKGYKPGWLHFNRKLLQDARKAYYDQFGDRPPMNWPSARIKAFLQETAVTSPDFL